MLVVESARAPRGGDRVAGPVSASRTGASASWRRSVACRRTWSTASPRARWSSGRPPRSRSWSRTRSTPAPRRIEVELAGGGRELIVVTDDGVGMAPDELAVAIERHATSKLAGRRSGPDPDAGLSRRGAGRARRRQPAQPVARRPRGQDSAFAARGRRPAGPARPRPPAGAFGTRVEVRDLFFATPARLKFLKSERAETQAAREAVERLAMAHPEVALQPGRRWPPRAAPGARRAATAEAPLARAARRASWGARSPTTRSPIDARARRRAAARLRRPADREPQQRALPAPVRQPPAGPGPPAARAPCARPTAIFCSTTASRWRRCSSSSRRNRSTSTSIRPRPRCAFGRPPRSAAW